MMKQLKKKLEIPPATINLSSQSAMFLPVLGFIINGLRTTSKELVCEYLRPKGRQKRKRGMI